MQSETFLSDKQLSLRYNIGRSSVWRWLKEGKLPNPTRFGFGTTRWSLSELEKWESEQKGGRTMKTANPHHEDQPLIFQQNDFSIIKLKQTKLDQVFKALLNGWKGNRFDAERQLHDHVLPSTIYAIENKYSVTIQRESETVPGYNNSLIHVMKYYIAEEERAYFLRRIS